MFRNDRFTGFDGEGGWQKWKIIINKDARFKQLGHLLKILKKLRRRARILFNVTPIVLLQLQKSIQFYKSNIIKKIFFIVWTDRSQLTQKPSVSYYLCSCAISWLISSSSLIPVNSPEPTELELSCVTGANGQYSRFHRTHDTTTPQTHTHRRVEEHQEATTQEQNETTSASTINTRGSQETAAFTALDLSQMLSNPCLLKAFV